MGYVEFVCVGFTIFLMFRSAYLQERLKKYIDGQYPEEARIIRSHQWQNYPWSTQARTLRALVKKELANDPELAHRATKAKRSIIYLLVCCAFLLLMSAVSFIRS